ncbi:MAG: T9SS type A sorting domain-containing protein [Candidatus Neomarinimicrobiota bacterium]|jgi:hypothetical protein
MKNKILALLLVLLFSYPKITFSLSTNNNESQLGIYLLKDTLLTETDISQIDIDSLELNTEPWLSDNDIDFYDFSGHCIYLKTDKSHFFENYSPETVYMSNPLLMRKPFVFVTANERCYIGAFHSIALSSMPIGPYIDELDIGSFPPDVIHISRSWIGEDVRSHPEIKEALISLNLYHAGIEIELTSVHVVDNSDTSTIEYSYVIKNNDQDDLYVIDPLKMGSELFHFYTNGPNLWNDEKQIYLYSQYKKSTAPSPYYSWDMEWFTRIESNQRIERTVRLKGYPHIPVDDYVAYFYFANPKLIYKEDRYLSDGRLWLGDVESSILDIDKDSLFATNNISISGNPENFSLYQNYPNPFNSNTIIKYYVPKYELIRLSIYNIIGQEVEILVNEFQSIGDYKINWNAKGLPSGIYLYELKLGKDYLDRKKMLLLR